MTSRDIPCPVCGTPFDPMADYNGYRVMANMKRTRCSKECRYKSRVGQLPTGNPDIVPCKFCGKEFNCRMDADGNRTTARRQMCSEECKAANKRKKWTDKVGELRRTTKGG